MLPIEIISHLSRVMSLSLRLFGNIFGEELVIMILGEHRAVHRAAADDVPRPLTGGLQAFIFVLLSIIYLRARWPSSTSTTRTGTTPARPSAPAAA